MLMETLLLKGLSTACILAFFAGVVVFLRYLYGPKGKLRDPLWDKWNEDARLELVRQENEKALAALIDAFHTYARGFFSGDSKKDAPLQLKVDHTFRVLRHAEELVREEDAFVEPEMAHALRLAALFHDVGRFEQLRRYHTFADARSCSHGVLGARVLREQNFLRKEPHALRQLIITAVAAHNRLSVPDAVSGPLRPLLLALRDADKLDILHIMKESLAPGKQADNMVLLHLRDEPRSCSLAIMQALDEGRKLLYTDMRFYNDFRILLCSWLKDLHFPTSYRIVRREKCLDDIIDGLDALPDMQAKLRTYVEDILES